MSRTSLVLGGNGVLGRAVIRSLKQSKWQVVNLDTQANTQADINLTVRQNLSISEQANEIVSFTKQRNYDSIICVTGGQIDSQLHKDNIFDSYNHQKQISLEPALLAAHIATQNLANCGLLVFLGNKEAFESSIEESCPNYLCTQAIHHLAMQMSSLEELPQSTSVVTLLYDQKTFAADKVAFSLRNWSEGVNRPTNGSFVKFDYQNAVLKTDFV